MSEILKQKHELSRNNKELHEPLDTWVKPSLTFIGKFKEIIQGQQLSPGDGQSGSGKTPPIP